ncbi:MAG: zinc protease, partial [Kiritimatiellia bacterium]
WNSARYGTELGYCNASVRTDATVLSLIEMRKELTEIRGEHKITQADLDYMKGTRINSYPQKFETSSALLGEQANIWRYGLPADWPERYLPGIDGVDLEQAQQALEAHWTLDRTIWVVVGDKEVIREELEAFGPSIIELDADGQKI